MSPSLFFGENNRVTRENKKRIPPVVFVLQTKLFPDAYAQFLRLFPHSIEDADLVDRGDVEDFLKEVDSGRKGILVFCFSDREELLNLLNLMPRLLPFIQENKIVVAVFAKVVSRKIEVVLEKAGCGLILPYEISARGFLFKLKRHLAELTAKDAAARLALERARRASEKGDWQSAPEPAIDQRKKSILFRELGDNIRLSPPLITPYDFWLFRKTPYIRRYKGNWMVELIGPSPCAGKWRLSEKYSLLFPGEDMIWEWGLREPPGRFGAQFDTHPTAWVFIGKKPEYNWTLNRWAFISDHPGLYLVEEGRVLEVRFFETDEGIFDISDNSNAATEAFSKLKTTFDPDHFVELERAEKKDPSFTLPPPPNLPWADQTDSIIIPDRAWNLMDPAQLEPEPWDDPGSDAPRIGIGPLPGSADPEAPLEMQIPLGAEALRACGIGAKLRGEEIELLSYSEESPNLQIGGPSELRINDPVTLDVSSENLGINREFKLVGVIVAVDRDESGRSVFTIALHSESHQKLGGIREAVEKRQEQVLQFFKKAQGIE